MTYTDNNHTLIRPTVCMFLRTSLAPQCLWSNDLQVSWIYQKKYFWFSCRPFLHHFSM